MMSLLIGIYNMTQMNPSAKQRQTHRHGEQFCGCKREWIVEGMDGGGNGLWREWIGGWGQQMQTITYRMNKKQGPTVQHRELYLLFSDKP